ncbi:MAG: DUF308 domain-containing protein [Mycoplasmatales bacterium]
MFEQKYNIFRNNDIHKFKRNLLILISIQFTLSFFFLFIPVFISNLLIHLIALSFMLLGLSKLIQATAKLIKREQSIFNFSLSILLIFIGTFIFYKPDFCSYFIIYLIGSILIIKGFFHFFKDDRTIKLFTKVLKGMLQILLGLALIIQILLLPALIPFFIAIFLFLNSIYEVICLNDLLNY